MVIEHPEYIAVIRCKRKSHKISTICLLLLVIAVWSAIFSFKAKADVNIVYPDNYQFNVNTNEQVTVEVGKSPEDTLREIGEQTNPLYIVKAAEVQFKYSEQVPLSPAVQEFIWTKCKAATRDYVNYYYFMLGAIQVESAFKSKAVHYNSNGSVDRGLCQINSCNVKRMKNLGLINSSDDLFDIYKNIDCGFEMMNKYINMFGVSESAYYAYNTGREKSGSNANSRAVMRYMSEWQSILSLS